MRISLNPLRILMLALALAGASSAGASDTNKGFAHPDFQRGIGYAHSWRGGGGYGSGPSAKTLKQLRKLGVEWIAITPFAYQRTLTDTKIQSIYSRRGHETDAAMARDVKAARELGMRVLLKPHLWINRGDWPGDIRFESGKQWREWFSNYSEVAIHYATFAQENGIEMYSMGNELKGVTGREASDWRALVARIRKVYAGQLTYAANWDEYRAIEWWDALDAVGINAYFPLSTKPNPRYSDLLQGAGEVRRRLRAFQKRVGKPIIFTEIGFPSITGAAAEPWTQDRTRPRDLEIQTACYRAVLETFSGEPWMKGMYWWKWFSGASAWPKAKDRDPFSPRNKPAEAVLKAWYSGGR